MDLPTQKNKSRPPDFYDIETQASPPFLKFKQSNLKIVIEDFSEDDFAIYSPESAKTTSKEIYYIRKMIRDIKQLSKKSIENIADCKICHTCHRMLDKTFLLHCTSTICFRYFCFRCLSKIHKNTAEMIFEIMKADIWGCPSCGGKCLCEICQVNYSIQNKAKAPDFDVFEQANIPQGLNINENAVKEDAIPNCLNNDNVFEEEKVIVDPLVQPKRMRSKTLARKKLVKESDSFSEENEKDENKNALENGEKNILCQESNIFEEGLKRGKTRLLEKCHICERHAEDFSEIAICSENDCQKKFCVECIRINFDEDFGIKQYNSTVWQCYSCTEICKCGRCLRNRKKVDRPTVEKRKRGKPSSNHHSESPCNENNDEVSNEREDKRKYEKMEREEEIDNENENESFADPNLEQRRKFGSTIQFRKYLRNKRLQKPIMLNKKVIGNSKILSETNIDSGISINFKSLFVDSLYYTI